MHLKRDERPFQTVAPAVREGKHQPVSYWHETVDSTPGEPLRERLACDVAVVGGGFTGLSVAYHLKRYQPELNVVLLEQGVVGHGASGRNGGFAMPLLGWDLLDAVKKLGEAEAGKAYRMTYDAVEHVKRVVREHHIDCDLEATGYVLINTCAAREKRARKELEVAHRLGFDHTWLEGDDLAAHIKSERFLSGVFDPHTCIINPAKLARGLKTVVEEVGVKVYEQTPLSEMSDDKPARLTTPEGQVEATQVALCLNGYGPSMGFLKAGTLPVHTYIVLTEPLTEGQLREIGWAEKRASLETARNLIHYFRLTADNRILFGGEDADLFYGGRYYDHHVRIYRDLKARFYEYFPSLRDVEFTHQWGGVLGVSLDMFPTFGVSGGQGNIFHAGVYAGHGVTLSNYAGAILAPEMLRAAGIHDVPPGPELPFFYNRRPTWLPPDPARYVGMRIYRGALRTQDNWQGA